jgi:hypothetical protein
MTAAAPAVRSNDRLAPTRASRLSAAKESRRYSVGIGANVTDAQMQSASFRAAHPESAVFVSYVMRRAGAGSTARQVVNEGSER